MSTSSCADVPMGSSCAGAAPPGMDDFGGEAWLGGSEPDPGAWRLAVDAPLADVRARAASGNATAIAQLGVKRMLGAPGVARDLPQASGSLFLRLVFLTLWLLEALELLSRAAELGNADAQSALGFLHGCGYGVPQSQRRALLYHHFAAAGGNWQSKMAMGFVHLRQGEHGAAARLYADAAAQSMAANSVLPEALLLEAVRLHVAGGERNEAAVAGHRGERDDAIQFLEYNAAAGSADSLRALGQLYYWGVRGLRRDLARAARLLGRAAELGSADAMLSLGEMHARGVGVPRDDAAATRWFRAAADKGHASAHNGLGWLHARGQGVDHNFTKAMEEFMLAASSADDADAQYNIGVMHKNGLGVPRSAEAAFAWFSQAAARAHLAALYQLARMHAKGFGTRPNLVTAAALFKVVAERGPWGHLLRWAHSAFLDGDLPTAVLLYSRAAEMGYEVAQSNAAWLLGKKHQGEVACVSSAGGGRCSTEERQRKAHRLWRLSSEQGNVQAALLIGDAYYFGKGSRKDLERAAEAYRRAANQKSAQAMFNLGYMHEHGQGLPTDYFLAKRYYDLALTTDPTAVLPVKIALFLLRLRQDNSNSLVIRFADVLPELAPSLTEIFKQFYEGEGNVLVATLLTVLIGVLYIGQRQQRPAAEVPLMAPPAQT
eukprot:SM000169S02734  [mRNA]  locus=s169:200091:203563:- [translate_table: standard]